MRKVCTRIEPLGLELLRMKALWSISRFSPVFFTAFCVPVSLLRGSQTESCSFLSCSEGTSQPDSLQPALALILIVSGFSTHTEQRWLLQLCASRCLQLLKPYCQDIVGSTQQCLQRASPFLRFERKGICRLARISALVFSELYSSHHICKLFRHCVLACIRLPQIEYVH